MQNRYVNIQIKYNVYKHRKSNEYNMNNVNVGFN